LRARPASARAARAATAIMESSLWSATLPSGDSATPVMYIAPSRRVDLLRDLWRRLARSGAHRSVGVRRCQVCRDMSTHIEPIRPEGVDERVDISVVSKSVNFSLTEANSLSTDPRSTDATLAEKLRAIRREKGLTLQQVADGAGLSKAFVSQIESGVANPSLASLKRVGNALDIPLAALSQTSPNPLPPPPPAPAPPPPL